MGSTTASTRPSLRHFRFILVGALLAAAIIVATSSIIRAQRSSSIEAYRVATNNLGVGMARQTARSLGMIDQALRDLRDKISAAPGATPEQIATVMREDTTAAVLLDKRNRVSGVEAFVLIDQQGGIANVSDISSVPNLHVDDQELFAHLAANDGDTAFVGRPTEIGTTGDWTASMARRINSADGKFAGIVVAVLSLRDLEEFYHVAMPVNRSVIVARRDGVILVQYPLQANTIGATVSEQSSWSSAVERGGGTYVSSGGSGRAPVIASVNPLPDLPFVVEATVLETYALADWYRQRIWLMVGGGSASVCVVLLLWLFAAQYSRIRRSEAGLEEKNSELNAARGQLHAALSNISQGVCFFSADKKLVVANGRFAEIYDLPPEAIQPGISLREIGEARIVAGSTAVSVPDEYVAALDALAGTTEPSYFTIELKNGRNISIRHQPMRDGGWVAAHEDTTERREAETKIAFLATHDVLTGLANRALLQERMERAQTAAKRGEPFAVLFLDLDGFKSVNTSLGHQGGDELLHAVAKRLVACVREGDTVARTGGDEFVVLLQNPTESEDAAHLAGRILEKLAEPFKIEGRELAVGASIGIAVAPSDGGTVEALVRCADVALYVAKAEGRNRFRFFERQMDTSEKSYA
jgi:diguanylate cyclase (GGDEF)-like protein